MSKYRTYVDVLQNSFRLYPDRTAFRWRDENDVFQEMTYRQFEEHAKAIGVGLISLGVKSGQHVGLIADVSHYWNLANAAIQLINAADVPRGTDSTDEELAYILNHSGSNIVFVHNAGEIDKINKGIKKNKFKIEKYIVLNDEKPSKNSRNVMMLSELLEKGRELIEKGGKEAKELEKRLDKSKPEDLSTIVYTSGTTGEPKGVMLTQSNFASQMNILPGLVNLSPDDKGLTLLPPWHVFGRITEYLFVASGCAITYTDIKHIGEDLRAVRPQYVPAVPRIWEGVYNKILGGVKKSGKENLFNFFKNIALSFREHKNHLTGKECIYVKRNPIVSLGLKIQAIFMLAFLFIPKKLGDILVFKKVLAATGGQMKASISGGGALPGYVDDFFAAIGVKILEGYGLTETSPVLSVRVPERVVPGTVGPLIEGTEMRLIDLEGNDVTDIPDRKGTLHVRGPQIMRGYYKNPKKTKAILSEDGWFNTGDLVKITVNGELSIVGRSKDTIVLVGGENVEPTPIEEKLKESALIDHVMCVGQDKKSIGALIVPNEEELQKVARENGVNASSLKELIDDKTVNSIYKKEIQRLVSSDTGFKSFERVTTFALLERPFEQGVELNNTLKLKRHVVTDMYEDLIDKIYE